MSIYGCVSDLSSFRYDIDNDCVDDGGKEHSAIGMRLMVCFVSPINRAHVQTTCSCQETSTKRCHTSLIGTTLPLQSSVTGLKQSQVTTATTGPFMLNLIYARCFEVWCVLTSFPFELCNKTSSVLLKLGDVYKAAGRANSTPD